MEWHTDLLQRIIAILQRDLASPNAKQEIQEALQRRTQSAASRLEQERQGINKELKTLLKRRDAEARRLLILPEAVLSSASAAHQETLTAIEQVQQRLLSLSETSVANVEVIATAERALSMLSDLPELLGKIIAVQSSATLKLTESQDAELLAVRRKVRDVLFALIASVRTCYVAVSPEERKGLGMGLYLHRLHDVQVVLHPHIQDALLNVAVSGSGPARSSANYSVQEAVILSERYPLIA